MEVVEKEKIDIPQRSSEWFSFRAKRIGASDGPILCGHSPWKDAHTLWMEKTGKISQPDNSDNFAIQRGIRLEPLVLAMANIMLDRDFEPATFVHPTTQYLMASLDGWDEEHGEALEIKIGNKKDHDALRDEKESTPENIIVPRKYYAQLQQQMHVKSLNYLYFVSYYLAKGEEDHRGNLKIVKVLKDEKFMEKYLPIAEDFYHCLTENRAPESARIEL